MRSETCTRKHTNGTYDVNVTRKRGSSFETSCTCWGRAGTNVHISYIRVLVCLYRYIAQMVVESAGSGVFLPLLFSASSCCSRVCTWVGTQAHGDGTNRLHYSSIVPGTCGVVVRVICTSIMCMLCCALVVLLLTSVSRKRVDRYKNKL